MTKAIQNQIDRIENNERMFFWVLLSCLVLTLFTYGYCVNSTIFSVVQREKAEQSISSIKGVIAEKEAEYVALKSSITVDLATVKGFVVVANPQFVSRDMNAVALTLVR
ncbi:MAG: hypothetical protein WCW14_01370 [Candidatus Paceibacterota bacterium]|jgi:hypothetical protein